MYRANLVCFDQQTYMHHRNIAKYIVLHNGISRLIEFVVYIKDIDKILVVADEYRCNQILVVYLNEI